MISGLTPKDNPWLLSQRADITAYLSSPNFEVWKTKPGVALGIYAQVIEDYGWRKMKEVLSWYETAATADLPNTNQEKIDIFWGRYSRAVGVNLAALLTKWGIPTATKFSDLVTGLPAYT